MYQVTLEEAAKCLPELIHKVEAGEEIQIMRDTVEIARILPPASVRPRPRRGSHKGQVLYVAPDIDAIPEGFEGYLP
jgi:antitoxin (DNA-binding transcriptional repressor) of toxin-antitoxin stability system